jgi:hypothetical protein
MRDFYAEEAWTGASEIAQILALADSWLAQQAVIDAARLIKAYDQAGGNEWWEAHAKLYAALAAVDENDTEEKSA